MRRAAVAIRSFLALTVGVEGAFLLLGAVLVAYGASYLSPAGPPIVLGGLCLLAGIALAVPTRSR